MAGGGRLPWEPVREPAATPEPVPQPTLEELARIAGGGRLPWEPVRESAAVPEPILGKEDSPGKIHQRVKRAAEALQAIVLRLQEMDHQACLLAEQEGPSEEGPTQDQSTLSCAGADQAGLIAEGDVSRPEYGLPVVRLRRCPH